MKHAELLADVEVIKRFVENVNKWEQMKFAQIDADAGFSVGERFRFKESLRENAHRYRLAAEEVEWAMCNIFPYLEDENGEGMNVDRHCICGCSLTATVPEDLGKALLEEWSAFHAGDGHAACDAKTAYAKRVNSEQSAVNSGGGADA